MPLQRQQKAPDIQCARCHQKNLRQLPGDAHGASQADSPPTACPGGFTHAASGVHYRLFLRDGRAWLSYNRPDQTLKGEQELIYFIGSGQRGRTYLFQKDGFWFESPVNWYGKQRVWDMNPKSLDAREMPLTHPRWMRGCLHCHYQRRTKTSDQGEQSFWRATISLCRCDLPVLSWESGSPPGDRRNSSDSEPGKAVTQQAGLSYACNVNLKARLRLVTPGRSPKRASVQVRISPIM